VATVLQNLARDPNNPTCIIASIHQPSSQLYRTFDQLLVLSRGRTLYVGPGGQSASDYVAAKGSPCPPMYNIADHLLDLASSPPASWSPASSTSAEAQIISGPLNEKQNSAFISDEQGDRDTGGNQSESKEEAKLSLAHPPPLRLSHDVDLEMSDPKLKKRSKTRWFANARGQLESEHASDIRYTTTFFTQLEVLSSREWINLKRSAKSSLYMPMGVYVFLRLRQGQVIVCDTLCHRCHTGVVLWCVLPWPVDQNDCSIHV